MLCAHLAKGRARRQKHPRQIEIDHRLPLGKADLVNRGHRSEHSRIIEQNIEPPSLLDEALECRLDLRLIGHIGGQNHRRIAAPLRQILKRLGAARQKPHAPPRVQKCLRAGGTDAAACAGDHDAFHGAASDCSFNSKGTRAGVKSSTVNP